MFHVYSTYREFGLGAISQLTTHMTLAEAKAFVATLEAEQWNKDPHWKIIQGEIVEAK